MDLVELAVGLGGVAIAAPWGAKFALIGYQNAMKKYREVNAESLAMGAFKPVQQSRAEELTALVHRQQIAENTAKAITSEAALALTEATIEKALSSGDLTVAKQGLLLALPSSSSVPYPQQSQPMQLAPEVVHDLMSRQRRGPSPLEMSQMGANMQMSPFQSQGTDFYLSLLRNGYQRSTNGSTVDSIDGAERLPVDGELLPPDPVAHSGESVGVEREN